MSSSCPRWTTIVNVLLKSEQLWKITLPLTLIQSLPAMQWCCHSISTCVNVNPITGFLVDPLTVGLSTLPELKSMWGLQLVPFKVIAPFIVRRVFDHFYSISACWHMVSSYLLYWNFVKMGLVEWIKGCRYCVPKPSGVFDKVPYTMLLNWITVHRTGLVYWCELVLSETKKQS